ncbi:M14 family metallopeptidase [Bdellovibrionota bacterium FG-1]
MTSRIQKAGFLSLGVVLFSFFGPVAKADPEMRFIQISALGKEQRTEIANHGVSIEATRSDSVWGFATVPMIETLQKDGFKVLGNFDLKIGQGGHEGTLDFPPADSPFHTYAELTADLNALHEGNPDITELMSIGKTTEGNEMWALHINTNTKELGAGTSGKPGVVFMGNHHAREHLSLEVPYLLAKYLLDHRRDPKISNLLDSRDIWIVPMVNPDGAQYDIATGRYQWWRKNRRNNHNGTYGVDLNRNYGFGWGTGGSSNDTSSEVYMGPAPFSEPETQHVRDFVDAHPNTKVLLSFHTYSELILYPWGGKYEPVPNQADHDTFKKLAETMAQWNHYTPEQASDLYIASGDTTDWAYGTHGIFAFTFELSPKDQMDGGFYPGANAIDRVFNDNLKPCLYLLGIANDPHQVLGTQPTGFLTNYVEPTIQEDWML